MNHFYITLIVHVNTFDLTKCQFEKCQYCQLPRPSCHLLLLSRYGAMLSECTYYTQFYTKPLFIPSTLYNP